jgi:hypothetical protein
MRIIRVYGCHECMYSEGYRHDTLYICTLLSTAYTTEDVTISYENETLPENKCPLEEVEMGHFKDDESDIEAYILKQSKTKD